MLIGDQFLKRSVFRNGPSEIVIGRQMQIPRTMMLIRVDILEWYMDSPLKQNPTATLEKSNLDTIYLHSDLEHIIIDRGLLPFDPICSRFRTYYHTLLEYRMFPRRSLYQPPAPAAKQEALWQTLNSRKLKFKGTIFKTQLASENEGHILNWCECVINETISKPFNTKVILENYDEVQNVWKNIRTDKGKTRRAFIRLKLFVYCVKGNDQTLNQKINSTAASVQKFLKTLSAEQWCQLLKKVDIRVLINHWMEHGLVNPEDFSYFRMVGKKAQDINKKQPSNLMYPIHPSLATINSNNTNKNNNSYLQFDRKQSSSKRSYGSRNSKSNSRNSIKSNHFEQQRRSSIQDRLVQALEENGKQYGRHRKSIFSRGEGNSFDHMNIMKEIIKFSNEQEDHIISSSSSSQSAAEDPVSEKEKVHLKYILINGQTVVVQNQKTESDVSFFINELGVRCTRKIEHGEEIDLEEELNRTRVSRSYKGYCLYMSTTHNQPQYSNKVEKNHFISLEYIYGQYCFKEFILDPEKQSLTKVLHDKYLHIRYQEQHTSVPVEFKLKNMISTTAYKNPQLEQTCNEMFISSAWYSEIETSSVQTLLPATRQVSLKHTEFKQTQFFHHINLKYNINLQPNQVYISVINTQLYKIRILDIQDTFQGQKGLWIRVKVYYGYHISENLIPESSLEMGIVNKATFADFNDILNLYQLYPTQTYSKLMIKADRNSLKSDNIVLKTLKRFNKNYYVVTLIYRNVIKMVQLKIYWQNTCTYLQAMFDLELIRKQKLNKSLRQSSLLGNIECLMDHLVIVSDDKYSYAEVHNKKIPLEMVFFRRFCQESSHIYEQKCSIKQNSIKSYPLDLIIKNSIYLTKRYFTSFTKDHTEIVQLKTPLEEYFRNNKLLNPIKQTPPKISQYRFCRADLQSLSRNLALLKIKKKKQNRFFKIVDKKVLRFQVEDEHISITQSKGEKVRDIQYKELEEKVPFHRWMLQADLRHIKKRVYLACKVVERFI